jgi:uncharacterized protein YegP (UPF0339 family)
MHFQVYAAPDGWRWRLVADNNRTVASGEAYVSKSNAKRACRGIERHLQYRYPPSHPRNSICDATGRTPIRVL